MLNNSRPLGNTTFRNRTSPWLTSGAQLGNYPQRLNLYRKHRIGNEVGHIGPFQPLPDQQIVANSAMIQSGLIQTNNSANITGVLAELPFFDQLAYTEENIDSSATWGTQGKGVLTTQKHTPHAIFPIITRGAAFSADMLSQYETIEDALANVSAQLSRKINTITARSSAS